jgi:hypothetical protein
MMKSRLRIQGDYAPAQRIVLRTKLLTFKQRVGYLLVKQADDVRF